MRANLAFCFFLFTIIACAEVEESSEEVTAESVLSAGLAALSGAAHSASQATGIHARAVTGCNLAPASDTCSSGAKSASYANCLSPATDHAFSGSVSLSYSENNCDLTQNNQRVTRTLELYRILSFIDFPRFNNTTLKTSIETHTDYQGNEIGGGTRLTVTGSGNYDLEILGLHKVLTNTKEKILYDISIFSVSPVTISGDLSGDRILNGGQVQSVHNRAFFTADLTPIQVRYNDTSCCHPVSGGVGISFGGKAVGSAQIVFDQSECGRATLVRDEVSTIIPIHGCE